MRTESEIGELAAAGTLVAQRMSTGSLYRLERLTRRELGFAPQGDEATELRVLNDAFAAELHRRGG